MPRRNCCLSSSLPHAMTVGPPMPMPIMFVGRGTRYWVITSLTARAWLGASDNPAPYSAGHVGVAKPDSPNAVHHAAVSSSARRAEAFAASPSSSASIHPAGRCSASHSRVRSRSSSSVSSLRSVDIGYLSPVSLPAGVPSVGSAPMIRVWRYVVGKPGRDELSVDDLDGQPDPEHALVWIDADGVADKDRLHELKEKVGMGASVVDAICNPRELTKLMRYGDYFHVA